MAPLGPGPRRAARASKDGPLWAAEARAAAQAAQAGAAAGAAKRVTFSGVPCLEELRRGHKQQRCSVAQACMPSGYRLYRHPF